MSSDSTRVDTVVARLRGEDNARRSAFIQLAVDHALSLPVRDLVRIDDVADVLVEALSEDNAQKLIDEALHPARTRLREHFIVTKETPRDLVPADMPDRLVDVMTKGRAPRAAWAKGAVDVAPIRALFAPIVQDVLLSFAKKLPIPGLGGDSTPPPAAEKSKSSGLLGNAIRKRAESLADMGKAALGGLSSEIEKKVQATTRDFSQQAMTEIRGAIKDRLQSDEGRDTIRAIRTAIVERFLDTPIHVLMEDVERGPIEEIIALAPSLVAHNRHSPNLRRFIEAEVQQLLSDHGDRAVGDLLRDYGLFDTVRARVLAQLDQPVAAFIETDGFRAWLTDLLAD